MQTTSRYTRQEGLINSSLLHTPILMVGAGAIGSWTALALTKIGFDGLYVIDNDIVEEHNLGAQVYGDADIGATKTSALYEWLDLNSNTRIKTLAGMIQGYGIQNRPKIIISAVDNMEARKYLFERAMHYVSTDREHRNLSENPYFIDGRMAGNALNIFAFPLGDSERAEAYRKTLFSDEEAESTPCSEKAIAYNVFVCAGLIADIVVHILIDRDIPQELELDLANFAMYGGLQ